MKKLFLFLGLCGLCGCVDTDLSRFLEQKYPECSFMILEKTSVEYRVYVDCPGEDPYIETYRRR